MTQHKTCHQCKTNKKPAIERGTWNYFICSDCTGNYVSAWFAISEYPATQMLHDPTDLWNGWNNPKFTRAQAEKFIAWMHSPAQAEIWKESMPENFKFENDKLFTSWSYDNNEQTEWEEITPEMINGIPHYGIGSWSWCWQACETELEANEY
jgi:hypothetical protein